MGRAERRRRERQERIEHRKNGIVLRKDDVNKMKKDISDTVSKYNVETMMTCFGLAMHRLYGFGPKRIMRTFQYVDTLMGPIVDGTATIDQYHKELEHEVGITVKT